MSSYNKLEEEEEKKAINDFEKSCKRCKDSQPSYEELLNSGAGVLFRPWKTICSNQQPFSKVNYKYMRYV